MIKTARPAFLENVGMDYGTGVVQAHRWSSNDEESHELAIDAAR